jgi:DNA invertase Pin-like site-specific DNA recombinase
MAAPKLTARQVKEIRKHYADGESAATIAVWFDCSGSAVLYHTKDLRRPSKRKIDIARLRQMMDEGLAAATIARAFGCSTAAVHKAIKNLHVKTHHRAKLTPHQVAEVRRLWLDGVRTPTLANLFGVTTHTIYYRCKGLPHPIINTTGWKGSEEMARLKRSGVPVVDIAKRLGVNRVTVYRAIKSLEVAA